MKKHLLASAIALVLSFGLSAGSDPNNGLYEPGNVCTSAEQPSDFSKLKLDLGSNGLSVIKPSEGDMSFGNQKIVFTFGYGFGNFGATFFKLLFEGTEVKMQVVGPLHFRGEIGLAESFGVGVSVNFIQYSANWIGDSLYQYDWTFSNLSILARMNFHMNPSEKLDPYMGIGVGFKQGKFTFSSTDPYWDAESLLGNFQPFGLEITGGFRYYFTPNIGFYMEIGLAKSLFQGGLAIAF